MTNAILSRRDYGKTQHDGFEHLAINNTFFRRVLTRLALRTSAKFYKREGLCVPISKGLIVKWGFKVHLTEATTMRYIAENTTIPVPKVYCSFIHKNIAYIVMERIQGDELPRAWKSFSEEGFQALFSQLRAMFQELRALKPPPEIGVGSCVGGSLFDSRIHRGNPRFGPFKTIPDFHFWLRHDTTADDLKNCQSEQDRQDAQEMMNIQDGPWPPPVFTHCDLNPFNILVRHGLVVGIIDWEFSGWYPSYWEFTSAWYGNVTRTEWQGLVGKFLDQPSPEVLRMEEIRNRWWGE